MQITLVGTMGMRVTLRYRGRKDYVILSVEQIVFLSFVTNAFLKLFLCYLCLYKISVNIFLLLSKCLWVSSFGIGTSVWSDWSLEAPSDGDLLWLFLCRWFGSCPESQPLKIL